MQEYFVVKIKSCDKDGNVKEFIAEHRTLELATRDILTYKKRQHFVFHWEIERESRLF